jgi:hypothetical protein
MTTQVLLEHAVVLLKILNHLKLMTVDPTGKWRRCEYLGNTARAYFSISSET